MPAVPAVARPHHPARAIAPATTQRAQTYPLRVVPRLSFSRPSRPLLVRRPGAYAAAKARAAAGGPGGSGARARTASRGPRTSNSLTGKGFSGTENIPANRGSPPDTTGAIGPNHYLEAVNVMLGIYSRDNLTRQSMARFDTFVGKEGDFLSDPQIQWDDVAQRWEYAILDVDTTGSGGIFDHKLLFGWSKGGDSANLSLSPLDWCHFEIDTGNHLDDYPKLGHDDNHILIGSNVYFALSDVFETARIWAIAKPPAGDTSCASPVVKSFGSPPPGTPLFTADSPVPELAFTPVPANTADSSANGYVVAADDPTNAPQSELMVWHVTGSGAAPSLVEDGNVAVSTYALPAPAPQPGDGASDLDTLDGRLTQAVAHADPDAGGQEAVWTQHTVDGPGGRSVVRWYEVVPPAATKLRQQGTISAPNQFVFNGAVSPAYNGTSAALAYNTSGTDTFAQIWAQSRRTYTPLGQMNGPVSIDKSSAADADHTCGGPGAPCRWGDYAGASPDPDPNSKEIVWGSNQLNAAASSDPGWATRNFRLTTEPVPNLSGASTSIANPPPGGPGNGIAGPNQTIQVNEAVQNSGEADATGVTGALSSGTPGVTVTTLGAAYPTISPGQTVTNTTPFTIVTDGTVRCGSDINLGLELSGDAGTTSIPIVIPTGEATKAIGRPATDVPMPIADNGITTSTLTIPEPGLIKKAIVQIASIRHTFDGELRISIIAPDGTTVVLADQRGGSGDDFTGTTFDDDAGTPISAGTAPFSGSFRPEEQLAALKGVQQQGDWTLKVEDTSPGDTGTLGKWGTTIRDAQCGPPSARLTFGPKPVIQGRFVAFDASPSSDDGTIVRYRWDLNGDGKFELNTGQVSTVVRSYRRARRYRVKVRVTDDQGATAVASAVVRVLPDRRPPAVKLSLPRSLRRAAVLAHGVRAKLTSSEDGRGTVQVTLRVRRRVRGRSRPGLVRLAALSARFKAAKPKTLRLRLSHVARRRLRGARLPTRLTAVAVVRDSFGNARTVRRTVKLRR